MFEIGSDKVQQGVNVFDVLGPFHGSKIVHDSELHILQCHREVADRAKETVDVAASVFDSVQHPTSLSLNDPIGEPVPDESVVTDREQPLASTVPTETSP